MITILPPATIGIIGGGQLGRMMTLEAKAMGYEVIILDPTPNSPAAQVADKQITATYNDVKALERLSKRCDVITYEFENVDSIAIDLLEKHYHIPQKSHCLKIAQHRVHEKNFAKEMGIPCMPYLGVKNRTELEEAIKVIGLPAILKVCRNGYDGKGQVLLKEEDDIENCIPLLDQECILESYVPFDKEISIVVTRGANDIIYFPIAQNIHKNGILQYSMVPADINDLLILKAQEIAKTCVEALDYIGTFAIELFVKDEELYFNEMAPRPHNSAHYSIEGCNQSQFLSHMKAICGLPLFDVILKQPTIMLNILGQDMDDVLDYIKQPHDIESYLHLYGKDKVVTNRKMGHITFCGKNKKQLINEAKSVIKENYNER